MPALAGLFGCFRYAVSRRPRSRPARSSAPSTDLVASVAILRILVRLPLFHRPPPLAAGRVTGAFAAAGWALIAVRLPIVQRVPAVLDLAGPCSARFAPPPGRRRRRQFRGSNRRPEDNLRRPAQQPGAVGKGGVLVSSGCPGGEQRPISLMRKARIGKRSMISRAGPFSDRHWARASRPFPCRGVASEFLVVSGKVERESVLRRAGTALARHVPASRSQESPMAQSRCGSQHPVRQGVAR